MIKFPKEAFLIQKNANIASDYQKTLYNELQF
jgi:hypothetical protein